MNRRSRLREALLSETGCGIQHTGWPCNACFHSMGDGLGLDEITTHKMWHATLITRGDYTPEEIMCPPETTVIYDHPMTDKERWALVDQLLGLLERPQPSGC
jgi:hypothetical protein